MEKHLKKIKLKLAWKGHQVFRAMDAEDELKTK